MAEDRRQGGPRKPSLPGVQSSSSRGSDDRRDSSDRRGGSGSPESLDRRWSGRSGIARLARVTGSGRPTSSAPRTADQAVYDGPPLPEEITGAELDRSVSGPAQGSAGEAGRSRGSSPRGGRGAHRQDPETAYQHTLAARARAVPARRRPRGDRRGGLRRRPLRRGARRAAGRQADERRDRLPADDGGLPPCPRPSRAGPQAGQEPVGRATSLRRPRRR